MLAVWHCQRHARRSRSSPRHLSPSGANWFAAGSNKSTSSLRFLLLGPSRRNLRPVARISAMSHDSPRLATDIFFDRFGLFQIRPMPIPNMAGRKRTGTREPDAGEKVTDRAPQENRNAWCSVYPGKAIRLCVDRGVALIFVRLVPPDGCAGRHLRRRHRSVLPVVFYGRQMFLIELGRWSL